MKSTIHVETPDGQILSQGADKKTGSITSDNKEDNRDPNDIQDPKDIVAGPKKNPDPFANANLEDREKAKSAEGTGTEVTDGEDG